MKRILYIFIFLFAAMVASAQNATEAKMAYQLAEEKFDAKQYDEALDYLRKAETAFGSTNPPMAYLRVMIAEQMMDVAQIASAYGKIDEQKEALENLEKALSDFDQVIGKEALGDEKLTDVYRIRTTFEKEKPIIEKRLRVEQAYQGMVYHLAAEFPKTGNSVGKLLTSVPESWAEPLTKEERKQRKKEKKEILDIGDFYYGDIQSKQLFLYGFDFDDKNKELVDRYYASQLLKRQVKGGSKRKLTVEEICELLKISEQAWIDFTTGDKPCIEKVDSKYGDYFTIHYLHPNYEKDEAGNYKYFRLNIEDSIEFTAEGEFLKIEISNNTL